MTTDAYFRLQDHNIGVFKEVAKNSPMDPEVKTILVDALRSGKYTQTDGYLQITEDFGDAPAGFCCLGVLSEEAKNRGVGTVSSRPVNQDSPVIQYFSTTGINDKSTGFLIEEVETWAGLCPVVSSALMGMNDSGVPFSQIADLIEEYL